MVAQGTVSLAEDLELLGLMKRSGCLGLLVGFESVQKGTQNEVKKIKNLKIDFYEAMRRFHGEGFGILGSFVFGFDYENKDVFDQTLEFIMKSRMDVIQTRILTPYPGTRLYKRLVSEDRLLVPDWWPRGYPPDTLFFQPKGMTADELIRGYARLNRQAYSLGAMARRFLGMSPGKGLCSVASHSARPILRPVTAISRPGESPTLCRGLQRNRKAEMLTPVGKQ